MFIPVRYTIYGWTPPELSVSEKIWLGGEIAKVGRKAFAVSLRRKLGPPTRNSSNNKPFTFADVLRDAENMNKGNRLQPKPTMLAVLVALLFFGGCFWALAESNLIVLFLIVVLVVGSISVGSLLWMYNQVDRWVQSVIDEYAHAVANGGALPPHDSMSA